jgi:5-methyltetrahydropteroyltriglutamate--homocysteine methyltransferase
MKRSTERILTTHVGSLTRPLEIIDAMRARVNREPYDRESFAERLRKGVSEVVRRQAEGRHRRRQRRRVRQVGLRGLYQ